ncbi:MAG: helix-turn-helix domain-containing protein [Solirubrobacterales bacterium]
MKTREKVRQLFDAGKGVKEIARMLGLSPATVSYHKERLGYTKQRQCARRYDWAAVQAYYDEGHTRTRCQERYGFSASAWCDAVFRGDIMPRPVAMPLEKLLVAGTCRSRNNIKQRLIADGLKQNRCEECGIARWHKRPLSLCLHHVNGERHDNRLENLVLLCPNCHSQTPNFGVKNCRRRPG